MEISRISRMRTSLASAGALALCLLGASAAADEQQEVKTALVHATIASQQEALAGVQTHLMHTINCLVGGQGEFAFPDAMNPCQGMGQGAIADASSDEARMTLQTALETAQAGVETESFEEAQADAAAVVKTLKEVGN